MDTWAWCDPAGATNTSGSRVTAVTTLQSCGVYPRSMGNANAAPERYAAIQALAAMMRRQARDGGPALRVHPRTIELRRTKAAQFIEKAGSLVVDALSLAYVWDEQAPPGNNPNVRRPKKNHRGDKYSHLMNGLEYVALGEGLVHRSTARQQAQARQRLKSAGEAVAAQLRVEQGEWTAQSVIEYERQLRRQLRGLKDHDEMDHVYRRGSGERCQRAVGQRRPGGF